MPTISDRSSSVFQRLTGKKQPQEINSAGWEQGPPLLDVPAESDQSKSRSPHGHRRESSLLSLPSSVSDLGHNVRRSVSLRSHRTQGSVSSSSIAHRPRYPSPGNLLTKSPTLISPVEAQEPQQTETLEADSLKALPKRESIAQPPRSRAKLSVSSRSLSQRFKGTDSPPWADQLNNSPAKAPPVPAVETPRTVYSMLAATPLPRRATSDRPSLSQQASSVRDVSSSHGSTSNGVSLPPAPTLSAAAAGNPNAIYQSIYETSSKRMATIDYVRKVHEGNIFYFSTLHYTPESLKATIPSLHAHKLGRRAATHLILGYSLPLLLDTNSSSPIEYLKAITALLSEFETYLTLSGFENHSALSRARMGQMLKSGMGLGARSGMRTGRRSSAATDSIALEASKAGLLNLPGHSGSMDAGSPQDVPSPMASGHEFHYLLTPHLPFEPDFSMTFATLCETLIDMYANLLSLISGPDVCSPTIGEAFAKADKAVRKILISNLMREFEDSTRQSLKGEVAGLGKLVLGGLL